MSFKIQSNDPGYELVTKGPLRIHRESMALTTSTLLILCHVLQKMSEKCTKNRGARAEPSLLLMIPFVFGLVLVSRERASTTASVPSYCHFINAIS